MSKRHLSFRGNFGYFDNYNSEVMGLPEMSRSTLTGVDSNILLSRFLHCAGVII